MDFHKFSWKEMLNYIDLKRLKFVGARSWKQFKKFNKLYTI